MELEGYENSSMSLHSPCYLLKTLMITPHPGLPRHFCYQKTLMYTPYLGLPRQRAHQAGRI